MQSQIWHYVISVEWYSNGSQYSIERITRHGTLEVYSEQTSEDIFNWALEDANLAMRADHAKRWGLEDEPEVMSKIDFGEPFVVAWDLRPNIPLA